MARILLNDEQNNIDFNRKNNATTGFLSDRDLLKQRSKKYMDLISKIDAKNHTDTKGMEDLLKEIQEEFGTASLVSLPLGIVSKCFLGHPYEVHTIDLSGNLIINHYKTSEVMAADFEKARTLAIHNSYAMVEVYKDKMILIREDGSATKM